MKNKTILLISLIAVLGIGGWFAYRKLSGKGNSNSSGSGNNSSSQQSGTGSFGKASYPLKKGSRGSQVAELQTALNNVRNRSFAKLTVDGIWGDKTDKAIASVTRVPEYWNVIVSETAFESILKEIKAMA